MGRTCWILMIALVAGLGPLGSLAATVALHERSAHTGAVIVLGDLADVSAATAFERDTLASTPLMPAPAPLSRVFLSADDVLQLLSARGIDTTAIRFTGSPKVAVGGAVEAPAINQVDGDAPSKGVSIEKTLEEQIRQDLQTKTNCDKWQIELLTKGEQLERVAQLAGPLVIDGPEKPHSGRVMYEVSSRDGGDSLRVFAQVERTYSVVTAVRPIRQGDIIRQADVAVIETDSRPSSSSLSSVSEAVGMEATRAVAEGVVLSRSGMRAPLLVRRGETVPVFARAGGLVVRTSAVAKQDGAMGELVRVESLGGEGTFLARVAGFRKLEVYASGARAEEYATLRDDQSRLR